MKLNDLPAGSKIVKLVLETEPKLLKKGRESKIPCPVERLIKRSELSAMLGSNYGNAVNKQREREDKEPDFEPRLLWKGEGEHVEGSPFLVKRKGNDQKFYLAFRLLKTLKETYFLPDGSEVSPDWFKEFLPAWKGESEAQGVEKEVVWRTVLLENVKSVIYDGKEWIS